MLSAIRLPSIQEGFPHINFNEPPLPAIYIAPPTQAELPRPLELVTRTPAHSRSSHPYYRHHAVRTWHAKYSNCRDKDEVAPLLDHAISTIPQHSTPTTMNGDLRDIHHRGRSPLPNSPQMKSPADIYHHNNSYSVYHPAIKPVFVPQVQVQGQVYAAAGPSSASTLMTRPSSRPYREHKNQRQQQQRAVWRYSPMSTKCALPYTQSQSPSHSFDVLRSDPGTMSLEHIASSKTLQQPNTSASPSRSLSSKHGSSRSGVANGSAPAFRVALSPSSDGARGEVGGTTGKMSSWTGRERCPIMTMGSGIGGDGDGRAYFQVSDPSLDLGAVGGFGGGGGNMLGDLFCADGRGKKHQCPQCPKRFNRPSSLRIHVNTHTGARPYQCPHPKCGRQFNVNSNMRRHFRNHGMSATVPVYPPRHNSGRRPNGYHRAHPGRPVHSDGTGSGSASDEDCDMDGSHSEGESSDDGEEGANEGHESDGTVASLDVYAPEYSHSYPRCDDGPVASTCAPSLSPSPPPRCPSSVNLYRADPRYGH